MTFDTDYDAWVYAYRSCRARLTRDVKALNFKAARDALSYLHFYRRLIGERYYA